MSEVFSLSDVEIALQFAQLIQTKNVDISSSVDSKITAKLINIIHSLSSSLGVLSLAFYFSSSSIQR